MTTTEKAIAALETAEKSLSDPYKISASSSITLAQNKVSEAINILRAMQEAQTEDRKRALEALDIINERLPGYQNAKDIVRAALSQPKTWSGLIEANQQQAAMIYKFKEKLKNISKIVEE